MKHTSLQHEKAGGSQKAAYRSGTLEARLDALLPDWTSFDVIAHELWRDGDGGWTVNDSWHIGRDCDRDEAISHLRGRWEVFKVNYCPRAVVSRLIDAAYGDGDDCLLEVDCIAFAEVREGAAK